MEPAKIVTECSGHNLSFRIANFSKKILNSGILVETGETEQVSGHRGGNYYRFDKDAYDRFKQERSFKLEF